MFGFIEWVKSVWFATKQSIDDKDMTEDELSKATYEATYEIGDERYDLSGIRVVYTGFDWIPVYKQEPMVPPTVVSQPTWTSEQIREIYKKGDELLAKMVPAPMADPDFDKQFTKAELVTVLDPIPATPTYSKKKNTFAFPTTKKVKSKVSKSSKSQKVVDAPAPVISAPVKKSPAKKKVAPKKVAVHVAETKVTKQPVKKATKTSEKKATKKNAK